MDRLLARLHALRGRFDPSSGRARRRLLRQVARTPCRRAATLVAWHDELLFLAAFPDAPVTARLARAGLATAAARVARLSPRQRRVLDDTGIAGTRTIHTFTHGVARWLARHDEVAALTPARRTDGAALDPLVTAALVASEEEWLDSGRVGARAWLDRARGARTDLGWLLAAEPADRVRRTLWDHLAPSITWSLGDSPRSATHGRVAGVRPVHRRAFRRPDADPPGRIATPLRGIRRATPAGSAHWHDASLAALACRVREVHPTIHADPREVWLCPLGEGATLCVLGARPEARSALEANYGYVLFSNGVPIGYGGVTTLAAQANTGANLFEAFRRSEGAFLFAESLRAFRTLFGSTRFVVNPFQFGADNDEALDSGAYWFYDRLGFRSVRPALRALADRERIRLARDPSHRSSRATLRRLAGADLVLTLPGAGAQPLVPESLLERVGPLATRWLSTVAAGNREAFIEAEAARLLPRWAGGAVRPSAAERRGARLLLPVLAPLDRVIMRWPLDERRALRRLVALKGAAQERGFARAAARLPRLWTALRQATRPGTFSEP